MREVCVVVRAEFVQVANSTRSRLVPSMSIAAAVAAPSMSAAQTPTCCRQVLRLLALLVQKYKF